MRHQQRQKKTIKNGLHKRNTNEPLSAIERLELCGIKPFYILMTMYGVLIVAGLLYRVFS